VYLDVSVLTCKENDSLEVLMERQKWAEFFDSLTSEGIDKEAYEICLEHHIPLPNGLIPIWEIDPRDGLRMNRENE